MQPLLIRVDAGAAIGSGHAMRCLAVAQAWQEAGGPAIVLSHQAPEAILERLRPEAIEVVNMPAAPAGSEDASMTAELADARGAAWVLLDGYHFSAAYQGEVRKRTAKLALLDDCCQIGSYDCDLVIDPSPDADAGAYSARGFSGTALLGSVYFPLRREFRRASAPGRQAHPEINLLITAGGADAGQLTALALRAATGLPRLRVRAVTGHSAAITAELQELAARCRDAELSRALDDMVPAMTWADLAISHAGMTAWELAFMGVPSLLAVAAENQRRGAELLEQAQAARNLGWVAELDCSRLREELLRLSGDREALASMSAAGRRLLDGQGAVRIAAVLAGQPTLRRAAATDARQVWQWANDPAVRAASFHPEPIPWDSHVVWYRNKLADARCRFLIAEQHGAPVGVVRFDVEDDAAVVSLMLAREIRGRGLGPRVLEAGVREVFGATGIRRIDAYVKPDNAASLRAFARAAFEEVGRETVAGQDAVHMVRRREEGL